MKIRVIDVETTAKGPKGDPGWQWKQNGLLCVGYLDEDAASPVQTLRPASHAISLMSTDIMYVGHNLAFDIGWLIREFVNSGATKEVCLRYLAHPDTVFWDTMLVQYILSAQKSDGNSLSLKKVCEQYGIDRDWGLEGIQDIESISTADLLAYNAKDLENTMKLYQKQLRILSDVQGGLEFVISQLRAQKHTILASIRGMLFDAEAARIEQGHLTELLRDYKEAVTQHMKKSSHCVHLNWNPDSNQDIGTFLFGGEKKYTEEVPIIEGGTEARYKSGIKRGQIKTHKKEKSVVIPAMLLSMKASRTPSGQWEVSDEVLSKYKHPIIDDILAMRKLKKEVTTYYDGMLAASDTVDQCIHPSFNHCVTATGRLSCSKPNLQNITGGDDE